MRFDDKHTKANDGMDPASRMLSQIIDDKNSISKFDRTELLLVKKKLEDYLAYHSNAHSQYDSVYIFKENRKSELVLITRLQALSSLLNKAVLDCRSSPRAQ